MKETALEKLGISVDTDLEFDLKSTRLAKLAEFLCMQERLQSKFRLKAFSLEKCRPMNTIYT